MKHKIVNKHTGAVLKEGFGTKYAAEQYLADMSKTDIEYTKKYYISVPYHWGWLHSNRHNDMRWMPAPYIFNGD